MHFKLLYCSKIMAIVYYGPQCVNVLFCFNIPGAGYQSQQAWWWSYQATPRSPHRFTPRRWNKPWTWSPCCTMCRTLWTPNIGQCWKEWGVLVWWSLLVLLSWYIPSCVVNYCNSFNSLAPGGYDYSLKLVNFKLISMIIFAVFSVKLVSYECHKTSLIIKSTLVQVMAWCQATSHYLSQCWPRSLSPYDITRPQWFGTSRFHIWVPSFQIVAMAWVKDGAPGC